MAANEENKSVQYPHSWYYHCEAGSYPEIMIGPCGHACAGWYELGPVLTPPVRQGNPFYMEHELILVMARHELIQVFTQDEAGEDRIYYGQIEYQVPGVPTNQPMEYDYIRWFDERKKEYMKRYGNKNTNRCQCL